MTSRIGQPDTDADLQLRECLSAEALTSFVMVAGAGSGKTTSLVKALAHLEQWRGPALRRRGQKVACITYTEVAVHEIWGDVGNDPLFHISTIHSFLWTLVRPFQADIKAWVQRRLEEKLAELKDQELKFSNRTQDKTKLKNADDQAKCQRQLAGLDRVPRFTYGMGSDFSTGTLGHDDILKVGADLIGRHSLMRTLVAQRFPYVFIDESQDTVKAVVDAFRAVDQQMGDRFCLGFFGDPMQKIYATGAGEIPSEDTWATIAKPENFRCPVSVLSVINNVRRDGDPLTQTRGRTEKTADGECSVQGSALFFICPADENRAYWLERVRHWMAEFNEDAAWLSDEPEADVRILVIVHRMAARRLGFEQLYSAFNDGAPVSYQEGLRDGTHWALQPFLRALLPLIQASEAGESFRVMALLREHCPLLQKEQARKADTAAVLSDLKAKVVALVDLMSGPKGASVGDVLSFLRESNLVMLDERFDTLQSSETAVEVAGSTAQREGESEAFAAFLACPVGQLRGYRSYIETESPFSTQHGIKGAEFKRVLTVLDDEEGAYNLYSYGKYLGLISPSANDEKNRAEGKETVVDRTRKLFYVCCSRATKDLAVVLFTPEVEAAAAAVHKTGHFPADSIVVLSE